MNLTFHCNKQNYSESAAKMYFPEKIKKEDFTLTGNSKEPKKV